MNFTQKIYYNDKPLILTTDNESYLKENPSSELFTYFFGATIRNLNQALTHLDMPGSRGSIIEEESAIVLQQFIHDMFVSIEAGGGLVYNENNAILMIFRRGKWDLPKGKLDYGETMEECALREVKEETGLINVEIGEKLGETHHIYTQHDELMLKRSVWYHMKAMSSEKLKPQKEEQIMEVKWVNESSLTQYALKSYESVREVLRFAGLKW